MKIFSLFKDLFEWWQNLTKTFGFGTIVIITTVYSTQGFRSFHGLAQSFFMKDYMGLEPSVAQSAGSLMHIPWLIKPLYGIISDTFPIRGQRRKPYLILMAIIGFIAWVAISNVSSEVSLTTIIILFFVTNLSGAVADVLVDALVVTKARIAPETGSSDLQSLSWIFTNIFGLIGSLLSGIALTTFQPSGVFFIASFGSLVMIPAAIIIKETSIQNHNNNFFSQMQLLYQSLKKPTVWKPALWIFLSHAIIPGYGTVYFYFITNPEEGTSYTNCHNVTNISGNNNVSTSTCETLYHNNAGLGFDEAFLSKVNAIGSLAALVSTCFFNWKLKHFGTRTILLCTQIALAIISVADIILLTGMYRNFGTSAKMFTVGSDVIATIISRFQLMPVLVLCGKICPEGVEATLFALLMSIWNGSWSASSYIGSIVMEHMEITRTNFDNLWLMSVFSSAMTIFPMFFLFLMPDSTSEQKHSINKKK